MNRRRIASIALSGITAAAMLAGAVPASAASSANWTPASVATTAPSSGVQMEVVPVTGYTGGTAGVWLQSSSYMTGAMDVAAGVPWDATGWSVNGISTPSKGSVYYQVIAVKIGSITYGSPTSNGTWVTGSATGYTDQPSPKDPPTPPTSTALTTGTMTVAKPAAVVTVNTDGTYSTNGGGSLPTTGVVQANVGGKYSAIPVGNCTSPDVLANEIIDGTGVTVDVCVVPQSSSETASQAAQQQASATPPFVGLGSGGSTTTCIGGPRNGQTVPSADAYKISSASQWCQS